MALKVLKPGKFMASTGEVTFSEAQLSHIVKSFGGRKVPIFEGHKETEADLGTVAAVGREGEWLTAQLQPTEWLRAKVRGGALKTVSVGLRAPGALPSGEPAWEMHHLAFLGRTPPALSEQPVITDLAALEWVSVDLSQEGLDSAPFASHLAGEPPGPHKPSALPPVKDSPMHDKTDPELNAQLAALTEQLAKLQAANDAKDALLAAKDQEAALKQANADLAACGLPPVVEKRLSALLATSVASKGTVANLSGGTETITAALLALGKDLGALLKDKAPGVTGLSRTGNPEPAATDTDALAAELASKIDPWVKAHPGKTRYDAYEALMSAGALSAKAFTVISTNV